jgi:hypothetical protein
MHGILTSFGAKYAQDSSLCVHGYHAKRNPKITSLWKMAHTILLCEATCVQGGVAWRGYLCGASILLFDLQQVLLKVVEPHDHRSYLHVYAQSANVFSLFVRMYMYIYMHINTGTKCSKLQFTTDIFDATCACEYIIHTINQFSPRHCVHVCIHCALY